MNKITALLGVALIGLSSASFAQSDDLSSDSARQQRMDEAYREHHEGRAAHSDAREAGHEFHNGVRSAGHAIHHGVRATGHAIHRGVRKTGHAIHRGVDKATGK